MCLTEFHFFLYPGGRNNVPKGSTVKYTCCNDLFLFFWLQVIVVLRFLCWLTDEVLLNFVLGQVCCFRFWVFLYIVVADHVISYNMIVFDDDLYLPLAVNTLPRKLPQQKKMLKRKDGVMM